MHFYERTLYTNEKKKEFVQYCWLDVNYLNIHFSPNRYHTGAIETNHHTWVATPTLQTW